MNNELLDKITRLIAYMRSVRFYKHVSFDEIAHFTGLNEDEVYDLLRVIRISRDFGPRLIVNVDHAMRVGVSEDEKDMDMADLLLFALYSMRRAYSFPILEFKKYVEKCYNISPDIRAVFEAAGYIDKYVTIKDDKISIQLSGLARCHRILNELRFDMLDGHRLLLQELESYKGQYLTTLPEERVVVVEKEDPAIEDVALKYGFSPVLAVSICNIGADKYYYIPDLRRVLLFDVDAGRFKLIEPAPVIDYFEKTGYKRYAIALKEAMRCE